MAEAVQRLTAAREERVEREVERIAGCAGDYTRLHQALLARRLAWWDEHHAGLDVAGPLPRQAYEMVFLRYMGLDTADVPVVYEDERRIVWRSANFCPTLEACRRLGLDTRVVCRAATERSVEALIRRLDDRLRFGRNYETGLRPYAPWCEEEIYITPMERYMDLLEGLRLLQQGEWDRAHKIAQADESKQGSWLHGIVHMAEPDEDNSRYWYRMAGRPFPGMDGLASEMAALEQALRQAA